MSIILCRKILKIFAQMNVNCGKDSLPMYRTAAIVRKQTWKKCISSRLWPLEVMCYKIHGILIELDGR